MTKITHDNYICENPEGVDTDTIKGLNIFLSGTGYFKGHNIKDLVVLAGGEVQKRLDETTDLLIVGESSLKQSRIEKAKELKKEFLNESEFLKRIVRQTKIVALSHKPKEDFGDPPWVADPELEDQLVRGEYLAQCIEDLLKRNDAETVAIALGYYDYGDLGQDVALVDQLNNAIKECDLNVASKSKSYGIFDIYKNELCFRDDTRGLKIYMSKKNYDKNPNLHNSISKDFYEFLEFNAAWVEENMNYTNEDAKEEVERMGFDEPMMVADISRVVLLSTDLEVIDPLEDKDLADYYGIPYQDCIWDD